MVNEEFKLKRNCNATLVPAGDVVVLEEGTTVCVTQALGGTVTIRTALGLFRLGAQDIDALSSNLAQQMAQQEIEQTSDFDEPFSENLVWDALKGCFDPEIPINIVDLGLIYDLVIEDTESDQKRVKAKMTLTAQGCGMGPTIAADARAKIEALPQVESAEVEIVWDPAWSPQMISEAGRKTLGIQ